jgi:hypothetical protein
VLRDIYNNQKKFDDAANMAAERQKRTPATPGGAGANAADLQPGRDVLERQQACRSQDGARRGPPGRPEPRRSALQRTAHLNAGELKDALTHFEAHIKVAPTGPKAKEAEMFVTQLKTMVK